MSSVSTPILQLLNFSAQDGTYYADRVVTITGPLDNCEKALELIFDKMRKCAEQDQQNFPVSEFLSNQ